MSAVNPAPNTKLMVLSTKAPSPPRTQNKLLIRNQVEDRKETWSRGKGLGLLLKQMMKEGKEPCGCPEHFRSRKRTSKNAPKNSRRYLGWETHERAGLEVNRNQVPTIFMVYPEFDFSFLGI